MIGATLIGFLNIEYILLLDVVGALIACVSLLFVPMICTKRKSTENNIRKEIKECFMAIGSKIGLPYLFICFTIVTFAVMPVAVLVPLMTVNHFGGSTFQMGLIEVVWGSGALIGGFRYSGLYPFTVPGDTRSLFLTFSDNFRQS